MRNFRLCDELNSFFSKRKLVTSFFPGPSRAWKLIEDSFVKLASISKDPQTLKVCFVVTKNLTTISLNDSSIQKLSNISVDDLDWCVETGISHGLNVNVIKDSIGTSEEKICYVFKFTPSNI